MIMTIIRISILYLTVVFCMRIMGKRQLGELQPSELVATILISELASIPMQDLDRPITSGIVSILMLAFLEILLSVIVLKSSFLRKIFEGKSAIIIKNGVVDQKMMRKLRITIDDLLEGLRQSGNFSITEVDLAIMETNGNFSVQPKPNFQPVTKKDMKIKTKSSGLDVVLISDGKLIDGVFEELDKISKIDVLNELKKQKLSIEEVFLMCVNELREFFIIRKEI